MHYFLPERFIVCRIATDCISSHLALPSGLSSSEQRENALTLYNLIPSSTSWGGFFRLNPSTLCNAMEQCRTSHWSAIMVRWAAAIELFDFVINTVLNTQYSEKLEKPLKTSLKKTTIMRSNEMSPTKIGMFVCKDLHWHNSVLNHILMSKFKIPKQKTQHLENIIPTALFTSVHLLQTALLLIKQYQWYSEIFEQFSWNNCANKSKIILCKKICFLLLLMKRNNFNDKHFFTFYV